MSTSSFYPNKKDSIKKKVQRFEEAKRQKARKELALNVFRMNQRKIRKSQICEIFSLTEKSYKKLLHEGEVEYQRLRETKE